MDPVVVTVSHSLSKDEVVRRLQPWSDSSNVLVVSVEHERWSDDRMDFRVRAFGQAVTGNVLVGNKQVRIKVTLLWLLATFADVVQTQLSEVRRCSSIGIALNAPRRGMA